MGFHKPLIRPYFWGGYVRGGWLTSHNTNPWSFMKVARKKNKSAMKTSQVIPEPETNSEIPMKIPIFPGKYHQNGGFSSQLC